MSKVKQPEPPLCARPEVIELVTFFENVLDDFNNRASNRHRFWHDGEGGMLDVEEAVVERLEALGFVAEVADGQIGRKKGRYLRIGWPEGIATEANRQALKDYKKRKAKERKAKRS